ncbi:hypothetical protein ACFWDA_24640 [Rhodococcus zopfii]|uniref:hypothetical protein n=1 Tax=Rhodococcus zopfii TaxID=43772 RepID=UPI00365FA25E
MTILFGSPVRSMNREGRTCTCAGTAPGFPQHEIGCGTTVVEPVGVRCCGWADGICDGCPSRKAVA